MGKILFKTSGQELVHNIGIMVYFQDLVGENSEFQINGNFYYCRWNLTISSLQWVIGDDLGHSRWVQLNELGQCPLNQPVILLNPRPPLTGLLKLYLHLLLRMCKYSAHSKIFIYSWLLCTYLISWFLTYNSSVFQSSLYSAKLTLNWACIFEY